MDKNFCRNKNFKMENIDNIPSCTFSEKNIINFFTQPPKNKLKKLGKKYIIQNWINFKDPEFNTKINQNKNNGLNIYALGYLQNELYIVCSNDTSKLFRNICDLNRIIGKYANPISMQNNAIIIPPKLKNIMRKKVFSDSKEYSGTLTYNSILITETFSWKYILPILKNISVGMDDNVQANSYDKITFHTHPLETYYKIKTKVAWPSVDDYLVVNDICKTEKKPVYHIVASVEGIYLIIFNNEKKVSDQWIKNNLTIPYDFTVDYFLRKANIKSNPKTLFQKWDDEMFIF